MTKFQRFLLVLTVVVSITEIYGCGSQSPPSPPPAQSHSDIPSLQNTRGCPCHHISMPECGKDGNTYSNGCTRKCKGIDLAYQGGCNSTTQKNAFIYHSSFPSHSPSHSPSSHSSSQ